MMTREAVDKAFRKAPDATADDVMAAFDINAALMPEGLDERARLDVARALVRASVMGLDVTLDETGDGFYVESQRDNHGAHHVTLTAHGRVVCDCEAMFYGRVFTCVHAQTIRLRMFRSHGTRVYQKVARRIGVGTLRIAKLSA